MEREEAAYAEPMGDSGEQGEAVPLLIPECRGVSHNVFFFFFFWLSWDLVVAHGMFHFP